MDVGTLRFDSSYWNWLNRRRRKLISRNAELRAKLSDTDGTALSFEAGPYRWMAD
jgi:hypothetical protein